MYYRAIKYVFFLLIPFFANAHDIDQDDIYDMMKSMDYMTQDVMKETNSYAKRSTENWFYGTWTFGNDTFSAYFPAEPKEEIVNGKLENLKLYNDKITCDYQVLRLSCDVDETTNYSIGSYSSEKLSSVEIGQIFFQMHLDDLLRSNVHIIDIYEEECSFYDGDKEDEVMIEIFYYNKDKRLFCKDTHFSSNNNAYVLSSKYKWDHLNQQEDFVISFQCN